MTVSRLRSETGIGLVSALLVLVLMFMLGLAVYAQVDTQVSLSRVDRERESAFNLAEAALSAHIFVLSKNWPDSPTNAFPAECDHATTDPAPTAEPLCPLPVRDVASAFQGADFDAARTQYDWTVRVVDNDVDGTIDGDPLETYFSDTLLGQADAAGDTATYDRNDDGKLWVRAEAEVRDRTRILVAQLKVEEIDLSFPQAASVSGSLGTNNNGNDNLINQVSSSNQTAPIYVNCASTDNPSCFTSEPGQTNPDPPNVCFTDEIGTPECPAPTIPPELLEELRQTAQAQGNYFAPGEGCPTNMEGRVDPDTGTTTDGSIVFIEGPVDCPPYNAQDIYHSPENPGVFVVANGTLKITGGSTFYGVIYAANLQMDGPDEEVVELSGNTTIVGTVIVGNGGGLSVGSTGNPDGIPVLQYDPNAISNFVGFGTAGIVQNTWRELGAN